MSPAQELHRTAMISAERALEAFFAGDIDTYRDLTGIALQQEKSAADYLKNKITAEPTRSILYLGAAQLAFNYHDFEQAEDLLLQASMGNPPAEIRTKMRALSLQVLQSIEMQNTITQSKEAPHYIQQLRDFALTMIISPKRPTHLTAVHVDNVIEVLRKVKESFLNYLEINFRKRFEGTNIKNLDRLLSDLRIEASPILVNVGYSSFAASISSDLVVMTTQYSQEINVWKRSLFARYQNEVFGAETYESEGVASGMAQSYNPEERNKIFKPVVDLFKDSNKYTIALTGPNFTQKKKVYKPVSMTVKRILIPELPQEEGKNKDLFQIWGMGDAESNRTKLEVFSKQVMESASFSRLFPDITFDKFTIYLKEALNLTIRYEKPVFFTDFDPLRISLSNDDYMGLVNAFQQQFIDKYFELNNLLNESLSEDEISQKEYLDEIVLTISQGSRP